LQISFSKTTQKLAVVAHHCWKQPKRRICKCN